MMLAGYETSSSTIAFACHLLSQPSSRSAQHVLQQEIDRLSPDDLDGILAAPFLDAVVKETLRVLPPAHLTVRVAPEAMVIGGAHLPLNRGQNSSSLRISFVEAFLALERVLSVLQPAWLDWKISLQCFQCTHCGSKVDTVNVCFKQTLRCLPGKHI